VEATKQKEEKREKIEPEEKDEGICFSSVNIANLNRESSTSLLNHSKSFHSKSLCLLNHSKSIYYVHLYVY
jgi:Mg2+ and Co2+ transporter CorA